MNSLQVNCRPSQDMAIATARQNGVSILIISEPNNKTVSGKKGLVLGGTAFYLLDQKIKIINSGDEPGFAYVSIENLSIYSCYSSGNAENEEIEEMLFDIQHLVRYNGLPASIAGDSNVKSSLWGMPRTDVTGLGSILDLTLANDNTTPHITEWQMLDDETLSGHNYVSFNISVNVVYRCINSN